MNNLFPASPATEFIYLVFFTEDCASCLEAYAEKNSAERAAAHYKRKGFSDVRIDARAIRGDVYLQMIGA
jgi:disulfide oxidoreductase YuzD